MSGTINLSWVEIIEKLRLVVRRKTKEFISSDRENIQVKLNVGGTEFAFIGARKSILGNFKCDILM